MSNLSDRGEGVLQSAKERVTAAVKVRNGVPMLPKRGEVVTLEHVRAIIDEECGEGVHDSRMKELSSKRFLL